MDADEIGGPIEALRFEKSLREVRSPYLADHTIDEFPVGGRGRTAKSERDGR